MFNDKKKTESFASAENKFTNLEDLVSAPLAALTSSNAALSKAIVDTIKSAGTETTIHDDKVVVLDNINLGYQQVKQGENNTQIKEDMTLQIPLLSIMTLSNLQIKHAKIDFNAEVRGVEDDEFNKHFEARVCAPESRSTDYLSKMHFEIEVESLPVTEGMARCNDVLNMHQIPKKLDSRPMDASGQVLIGEKENSYKKEQSINAELKEIVTLRRAVENYKEEKILKFNAMIKSIDELKDSSYETFIGNKQITELRKLVAEYKDNPSFQSIKKVYDSIQRYSNILEKLIQKEENCLQQLIDLQIKGVFNGNKA